MHITYQITYQTRPPRATSSASGVKQTVEVYEMTHPYKVSVTDV